MFHPFQRFPFDVRSLIWEAALSSEFEEPRIIEVVVDGFYEGSWSSSEGSGKNVTAPRFVSDAQLSSLFFVCQESRAFALQRFETCLSLTVDSTIEYQAKFYPVQPFWGKGERSCPTAIARHPGIHVHEFPDSTPSNIVLDRMSKNEETLPVVSTLSKGVLFQPQDTIYLHLGTRIELLDFDDFCSSHQILGQAKLSNIRSLALDGNLMTTVEEAFYYFFASDTTWMCYYGWPMKRAVPEFKEIIVVMEDADKKNGFGEGTFAGLMARSYTEDKICDIFLTTRSELGSREKWVNLSTLVGF